MMIFRASQQLLLDIDASVTQCRQRMGEIDILAVAEAVQQRHTHDNIALEDIAELVLRAANYAGAPVLFESTLHKPSI